MYNEHKHFPDLCAKEQVQDGDDAHDFDLMNLVDRLADNPSINYLDSGSQPVVRTGELN